MKKVKCKYNHNGSCFAQKYAPECRYNFNVDCKKYMSEPYVYADNAATTKVSRKVLQFMIPYFTENYGNPSSLHQKGLEADKTVKKSRETIAKCLGCSANEIYFTSGGTEADNWAIKGVANRSKTRKQIITTKIEHPAVLNTCANLEKNGFTVTYVGVDTNGIVNLDELKNAVADDTLLVAVMLANNEIGTIQPIKEISEIAHSHGALMFTDAVQAVGSIPVNVKELGIDLLSFSGHKFHAPKGIGALYIKNGTPIDNLIDGGGQENGHRSGTENVPYIAGLACALDDAVNHIGDAEIVRMKRERLIDGLLQIPGCKLNGDRLDRLPNNVNVSFDFIEGESLMLMLDMNGICVSTGSACSSKSYHGSHVLSAIGLTPEQSIGTIRITLSRYNTMKEIDYMLKVIPETVSKLRKMNPAYINSTKG